MLTNVQREILEFVKNEYFHVSLNDFISRTGTSMSEAVDALKDLRKKRIVAVGPSLTDSFIGVTNYGWNVMKWR